MELSEEQLGLRYQVQINSLLHTNWFHAHHCSPSAILDWTLSRVLVRCINPHMGYVPIFSLIFQMLRFWFQIITKMSEGGRKRMFSLESWVAAKKRKCDTACQCPTWILSDNTWFGILNKHCIYASDYNSVWTGCCFACRSGFGSSLIDRILRRSSFTPKLNDEGELGSGEPGMRFNLLLWATARISYCSTRWSTPWESIEPDLAKDVYYSLARCFSLGMLLHCIEPTNLTIRIIDNETPMLQRTSFILFVPLWLGAEEACDNTPAAVKSWHSFNLSWYVSVHGTEPSEFGTPRRLMHRWMRIRSWSLGIEFIFNRSCYYWWSDWRKERMIRN